MFAPGEVLENKYRIIRLIGEGGMGAVFESEAIRLHRRVAIKVLNAGAGSDGETAARFQLEAQAAGRIGSRHIVEVLDLGQLPSGSHYMVMELLDGQSLRERIAARGPMPAQEILPIAGQLITGVSAAHAAGIIHRDLKPDNVFLVRQPDGTDFVKILDFGISKFNSPHAGAEGHGLSLTRTGALMGTPFYLSPEQANGSKAVDQRTDLYTLGVILYECLTGVVPHAADTFNQLLFRIVLEPPTPIYERAPDADPGFVALIARAMEKDPKLRFQSAEEMGQALQAWRRGESLSLRPAAHTGAPSADVTLLAAVSDALPSDSRGPSLGAVAERHAMTVASASESVNANRTVEPWSRSERLSRSGATEQLETPRSKLPWLVAGFAALAAALAGLMLVKGAPQSEEAAETPSLATTGQAVASEASAKASAPTPAVELVTSPPASLPAVASSTSRQSSAPPPVRAAAPANVRARAAAAPSNGPVPPQPAAAAPQPAVPMPPASPPASDSEVRMRGGRAIRGDL